MSEYTYNNKPVPESQLKRLAEEQGITVEELLQSMPDIKKTEVTTTLPEVDVDPELDTEAKIDNRGWFEQAMDAGSINADLYDDADAIFDIGNADEARKLTDEELNNYIELYNRSQELGGEMQELNKFTESFQKYNKQGENWLMSTLMSVNDNGIKGFAQASIQSFRSMANPELAKEAIAPTIAGASVGLAGTPIGSIAGGTTAFFTSMNYGLETINTFNNLLQEEILNNKEKYPDGFTPESIRMVMSDDEARGRIKSQARKRGATIATVEGVTNLVGIKGSGAILKTGKQATSTIGKIGVKTTAGAVATGTEIVGGGTGEYLGEKVIGKEASGVEIVLEGMAMAPFTGAKDVTVAALDQTINRPKYEINGKKVSKQAINDYVNAAKTAEEIGSLNVKIDNDDAFASEINEKIINTQLETQVDAKIADQAD